MRFRGDAGTVPAALAAGSRRAGIWLFSQHLPAAKAAGTATAPAPNERAGAVVVPRRS